MTTTTAHKITISPVKSRRAGGWHHLPAQIIGYVPKCSCGWKADRMVKAGAGGHASAREAARKIGEAHVG